MGEINKRIILIFICIIISAVSGCSTRIKKTYINESYNFSIQYPDNWAVTDELHDPLLGMKTPGKQLQIDIAPSRGSWNHLLIEVLNQSWGSLLDGLKNENAGERYVINGIEGIKYEQKDTVTEVAVICLPLNPTRIIIMTYTYKRNKPEMKTILENCIASFKLLSN